MLYNRSTWVLSLEPDRDGAINGRGGPTFAPVCRLFNLFKMFRNRIVGVVLNILNILNSAPER